MVHKKLDSIKLLITAFEPFNNKTENSSFEVLNHLSSTINSIQVSKKVLPVVYDCDRSSRLIEVYSPDIIIHLGEAGERTYVSLERRALNIMDTKIPDNLGIIKQNEKIFIAGMDEYITNIDVDAVVSRLKNQYPVEVSESAGKYICNQAFYCSMHDIYSKKLPITIGFIHIPRLEHQQNKPKTPTLSLEVATKSVEALVNEIINENARIKF